MALRFTSILLALLTTLAPTRSARRDRRIVDVVEAGNARSELAHGFVGVSTLAGASQGATYRQARGWMRYALTTFEDTDVTVAFTFVALDSASNRFDVVVEDSVIVTRSWSPGSATSPVVEVVVPFALTKGKNNIAVTLRARDGKTPALRDVRTIQDHLEDRSLHFTGAVR